MARCVWRRWCAACLLAAVSAFADKVNERDIEKWQGAWTAVSFETDGKPTPADDLQKIKLTVNGTDYHFQNGAFSEHGNYRFAAGKNPKELDIVVGDGADKGKIYRVIYQIEGDRLTICLEKDNQHRPLEFTGKAGSGCVLETWQRARP